MILRKGLLLRKYSHFFILIIIPYFMQDSGFKTFRDYYNSILKKKSRNIMAISLCKKDIPPVSRDYIFSRSPNLSCISEILDNADSITGGKLLILMRKCSLYLERINGKIFFEER